MREWISILIEYAGIYFLWANIIYGVMFLLAFLAIKRRHKKKINTEELPPLSFLIPSFNEETLIVETIQTYLAHPEIKKEIILIDDGSKDATLNVLKNFYHLQLTEEKENLKIYQSITHPDLKVIGSIHQGKAQALNIGLRFAKYDIVCTMDADTVPNHEGIVKCLHEISRSAKTVAVGGIITPLNGETIFDNQIKSYSRRSWLVTQQRLEFLRAFVCERLGQGLIQGTVLISGAMAMFKKESLIQVGGFPINNLTEDFAVIMNLRHHYKHKGQIKIIPVHTGWTQVPKNCKELTAQRSRWQMGLVQTLTKHLSMTFNPSHGAAGLFIVPYLWAIEVLSPIIELSTYILLPLAWKNDLLHSPTVLLYFEIGIGINLFITMAGLYLEQKYILRLKRPTYFFTYFWTALTAFFGYKQFLSVVRFTGMIKLLFKRSYWQASVRDEIVHSPR
ncbi:MAG: glycosyltransferase family 2 protein [Bacteriovoracaceae bacterium]